MSKTYTTTEIADMVGISRKTVWKFFDDHYVDPVTKKGNTAYYDEKAKDLVVTNYKTANGKVERKSKLDIKSDELRNLEAKYQDMLSAKDETIKALQKANEVLSSQLEIKDKQIDAWNQQATANNQLAMSSHQLIEEANVLKKIEMEHSKENSTVTSKNVTDVTKEEEKPTPAKEEPKENVDYEEQIFPRSPKKKNILKRIFHIK